MKVRILLAAALLLPCISQVALTDDVASQTTKNPIHSRPRPKKIARGQFCNENNALIEWACGGRPAGYGWVRVDLVCWHRDTGRECY